MMRFALLPLLIVAAPLAAQPIVAGAFSIAGQRFATTTILDARAVPLLDGGASILITFTPDGAKQLAALTKAHKDKEVAIALDGKTLMAPVVREPVESGIVEVSGTFTLAEAEALAKRISGKEPVPEEFAD